MQWWCSAQGIAWTWSWRPYAGVWLMVLALAWWYWHSYKRAVRKWGAGNNPRLRPARVASAIAGILLLWIALDWPVGTLGAGYLASVHMVQFLLIAMVVPALLVYGWPPAPRAAANIDGRRSAWSTVVLALTHPIVAIIIFDVVVVVTHAPPVVDTLMASQAGSFVLDMAWLVAGILFWWPIFGGPMGRAPLRTPINIAYIFASSLSHTGVSMYLLLARFPVYSTYELAPPISGISKLGDQEIAGGLMLLAGAGIVLGAISVLFFRWQAEMEREETGDRGKTAESRQQKAVNGS
jgi:cytochrome c oxidase assembly factor CtaG